jgi:hypothetical protein
MIGFQSFSWDTRNCFDFAGQIVCTSTDGPIDPESRRGHGSLGFTRTVEAMRWHGWFMLDPRAVLSLKGDIR